MTHTHACLLCRQPFTCDAPLERNHDGWPDPVCAAWRESNPDYQMCPRCRDEASPANKVIDPEEVTGHGRY